MKKIDEFLNSITMYRLMVYGLVVLLGYAVVLGLVGLLPYSGFQILISTALLYLACEATNICISRLLKVQTNVESASITALILALILAPVAKWEDFWILLLAGCLAMISKYLFAIGSKHLFNPAALSLFLLGLFGIGSVVWWVGTFAMLPVVIPVGLLVVWKLRRFYMFIPFFVISVLLIIILGVIHKIAMMDMMLTILTSWPIFFFGTIMLTEPLSTPPQKTQQILYGAIVGLFFGSNFTVGPIFSTPELALLIGNLFSYIVSDKQKILLTFKDKMELAPNLFEFAFVSQKKLIFKAGQYMEWTLTHKHQDSRGNRRYFTIASSPTEEDIRLTLRFEGENSSSFKRALMNMKPKEEVVVSQLAGDFILPKDESVKLVFIAGGIGITPFRSMVKFLIDSQDKRDITLFYVDRNIDDLLYRDIFDNAEGLKTVYLLTDLDRIPKNWIGGVGRLDEKMIRREVPDFKNRTFYISGPNKMVDSLKQTLTIMGIKKNRLVTDYFPGY